MMPHEKLWLENFQGSEILFYRRYVDDKEMISTVLFPELMTLYLMENEGIDRKTAVAKIFGTQGGHTLYHTYMVHAKQRGKENKKEPPQKKSKRKSALPRKLIRR